MDNPRLPYLREKTHKLPLQPGVYIMHEKSGKVIYVGKAKKLKNRVSSYFRAVENHEPKVYRMVEHVWDFDFIVTDSEFEALILECSLIKQYTPKYNILLKDDKGYSYVRISPEPWSRLSMVFQSQKQDDGATYIGPYISSYVVKQTVEEANKVFKLPTCGRKFPQEFRKGRPCLNFYIKQCMGLCRGRISEAEYSETFNEALDFVRGGSGISIEKLTERMTSAAENEEFERAAAIRDRIRAIERIVERQKVVFSKVPEQDVAAVVRSGDIACAAVLKFRGGRLVDKDDYLLKDLAAGDAGVTEFLQGYYLDRKDIPKQITLHDPCEDAGLLALWLSKNAGYKVTIFVPQRGEQRQTAEMAYNNAAERLSQEGTHTGREVAVLDELARVLGMEKPPAVIEAYDISNFGSETVVGGMVVYENARPKRSDYRRFAIKTAVAPDDYACMREMLERRFKRYFEEKDKGTAFGRMPDLILLDGGKGHVSAVESLLAEMGVSVPLFGMVKDDRHRTRAIAENGGEIAISGWRSVFNFVSSIQDEVHRYTIGYSRARHTKNSFALSLTKAQGIGKVRAEALMKHFKTIKALRAASLDELAAVEGMTRPAAESLRRFLNEESC